MSSPRSYIERSARAKIDKLGGTESVDLLSVRQVPPHDQRDLLLAQLLDSNLQRVGLSLQVDKDRCVHAVFQSR